MVQPAKYKPINPSTFIVAAKTQAATHLRKVIGRPWESIWASFTTDYSTVNRIKLATWSGGLLGVFQDDEENQKEA